MRPLAALVHPSRTGVLVVDVQPLFTEDPDPPTQQALQVLQRFLDAARAAHVLRVFIRFVRAADPDERWSTLWEEQCGADFIDLVAPDSPAAAFLSGFEPEEGDLSVAKDRYSAFHGPELANQLNDRGIETVIVAGFSTDVCVSSTARDAFQLDFNTVTLSDCCAASSHAAHDAALETLARRFGRVCTSDEVVAIWQSIHAPPVGAQEE
jgi:ureidoacrylate peracid hydrolase